MNGANGVITYAIIKRERKQDLTTAIFGKGPIVMNYDSETCSVPIATNILITVD